MSPGSGVPSKIGWVGVGVDVGAEVGVDVDVGKGVAVNVALGTSVIWGLSVVTGVGDSVVLEGEPEHAARPIISMPITRLRQVLFIISQDNLLPLEFRYGHALTTFFITTSFK